MKAYWNFAIFCNKFFSILYSSGSVDLFFNTTIATVLIADMGSLSIELNHSVSNLLDFKQSWIFCTKNSYKCQMQNLYIQCSVFFVAAFIIQAASAAQLINYNMWNQNFDNPYTMVKDAMDVYGICTLAIGIPLTLLIAYHYFYMSSTIGQCIQPELQSQRKSLNIFFAIVMASQMLRLIFSITFISSKDLICSIMLRRYLVSFVIFIFKATTILPMVMLHRNNFMGNNSFANLKVSVTMLSENSSAINDLPEYEESDDD